MLGKGKHSGTCSLIQILKSIRKGAPVESNKGGALACPFSNPR